MGKANGEDYMHNEPVRLQVSLAADCLRKDILAASESGGLQAQAYWLSTTLALGAFLKVCSQTHMLS